MEGGEIQIRLTAMHNSFRLCINGRVFVYLTLMKEHHDKEERKKKKVFSDTNNENNNSNKKQRGEECNNREKICQTGLSGCVTSQMNCSTDL